MGKTKLHIEKAKYEVGDPISMRLKKKFDRQNYERGESRSEYKRKKYEHYNITENN